MKNAKNLALINSNDPLHEIQVILNEKLRLLSAALRFVVKLQLEWNVLFWKCSCSRIFLEISEKMVSVVKNVNQFYRSAPRSFRLHLTDTMCRWTSGLLVSEMFVVFLKYTALNLALNLEVTAVIRLVVASQRNTQNTFLLWLSLFQFMFLFTQKGKWPSEKKYQTTFLWNTRF